MRRPSPWPLLALALLLAGGCTGKITAVASLKPAPAVAPRAVLMKVAGLAQVPASLVSNNAGSVIANNGGAVIADNGAGVVANHAAGRRILTDENVPVPGATVRLVDSRHQPLGGLAPATTDAKGGFSFQDVPGDRTFFVEVDTPTLHLALIVRPEAAARPLTVDPVSTVVAEHLRKVFADKPTDIEKVDAKELDTLTEQLRPAVQAQPNAALGTSDAAEQVYQAIAAKQPEIASSAKVAEEHARSAPDPTPAPAVDSAMPPAPLATPTLAPQPGNAPGATPTPKQSLAPDAVPPTDPTPKPTATPVPKPTSTPIPTPTPKPTATPTPKAGPTDPPGGTGGGTGGGPPKQIQ
ncbi:MAG: hypothetical protein JWM80_5067 [Cyanobacteria bacterium RYN_339]|nr:hypothetical protein [Cyanobacteria bacterium RYN_339]